MRQANGCYRGVGYKLQRICDVLFVDPSTASFPSTARWYFAYIDDEETCDHYRTLRDFRAAVDAGHFEECGPSA